MRSGIGRAFSLTERGAPTRQDPLGTKSTRLEKIRLYNNACLLEERMDEFFAAWDREGEAISLEHGSDRAVSLVAKRVVTAARSEEAADRRATKARDEAARSACGLRPSQQYGESESDFRARQRAYNARRRFDAVTEDQCQGEATSGSTSRRCRLRGRMLYAQAAPLRCGGRYCAHHEPDPALSGVTRCAGLCPGGVPCKLTSACSFPLARPLREGGLYCTRHMWQDWTPPAECVGAVGGCAAAVDADFDASVAESLGLGYCSACESSWRALGGWCSAEDRRRWFHERDMVVLVRCSALNAGRQPLLCDEHAGACRRGASPPRRRLLHRAWRRASGGPIASRSSCQLCGGAGGGAPHRSGSRPQRGGRRRPQLRRVCAGV